MSADSSNYIETYLNRRTIVVVLALTMLPALSQAEHEADHRYTVQGYVLDEQERPIAGRTVSIRSLGSAVTDGEGAYSIRMHLHNSDLGRELRIRSGEVEEVIRVSFDVNDSRTPREFHANFVGGKFVAGKLDRRSLPVWTMVGTAAGVAAVGGLLTLAVRRGRRARPAVSSPHPTKRRRRAKKKRKR